MVVISYYSLLVFCVHLEVYFLDVLVVSFIFMIHHSTKVQSSSITFEDSSFSLVL